MPKHYKKRERKTGTRYEHRAIWEEHYGAIPRGFQIHHKDRNKHNNAIENLECLSPQAHRAIHTAELRQREFNCARCGKPFRSGSYLQPLYCGKSCKQMAWRTRNREVVNAYKKKWRAKKRSVLS